VLGVFRMLLVPFFGGAVGMFVEGSVGGDGCSEDAFTNERNYTIADGGDADRADIADDENQQKVSGFAMQLKKCGGNHGTESNVERVKNCKERMAAFLAPPPKNQHKKNACEGSKKGKRRMFLQFVANEAKFFKFHNLFLFK